MKPHERQAAHSVEKIGGTSMSNYAAVRDNIILRPRNGSLYQRVFVVSAYGGVTDQLLEDKKNGRPGIYALFAGAPHERNWREALLDLRCHFERINAGMFKEPQQLASANTFIGERLLDAEDRLGDLDRLCRHANFERQDHLDTVREMLASLGEAHSAWNMAQLLRGEGLAARFVDLTAWHDRTRLDLDERIRCAFAGIDLSKELPIVTGYAHSREGLMRTFARGYSEMTFSRIAVITEASEGIIHKEYHLSSADPRLVGEQRTVPIGRTNYDVADQLANLGMEAIHPKAAKGLRQREIPLRVMNSYQPEHSGTLITSNYVSEKPRVEIIAGRKSVFALECFDQEMMDCVTRYDRVIDDIIEHYSGTVVTKDTNANTITHFLADSIETVERIRNAIGEHYSTCDIQVRKVAVVSAIGSNMDVPGMLPQALTALARSGIDVLAVHQPMRQVDIQFVVGESDYENTVVILHRTLVENCEYSHAVCAA